MSKVQSPKSKVEDDSVENLQIIDGELLEVSNDEEIETEKSDKLSTKIKGQRTKDDEQNQTSYLQYIFLPLIFLTVALLGGLRFGATDGVFIFLKPPLVCLIFPFQFLRRLKLPKVRRIRHETVASKFGRFVRVGVCREILGVGKSDRARQSKLVANDFVRQLNQRSLYIFARFAEVFTRDRLYPIFRACLLSDWIIFGQASNC